MDFVSVLSMSRSEAQEDSARGRLGRARGGLEAVEDAVDEPARLGGAVPLGELQGLVDGNLGGNVAQKSIS